MSPPTIHFRVLDKSPVLGPGRGPLSYNRTMPLGVGRWGGGECWEITGRHWESSSVYTKPLLLVMAERGQGRVRPRGVSVWHPVGLNGEQDTHRSATEKCSFCCPEVSSVASWVNHATWFPQYPSPMEPSYHYLLRGVICNCDKTHPFLKLAPVYKTARM